MQKDYKNMGQYSIHITAFELFGGDPVLPKIKSINEFAIPWFLGLDMKKSREIISNYLNTQPDLVVLSSFDFVDSSILDDQVVILDRSAFGIS